jgi:SAM-dependent methyltransferase
VFAALRDAGRPLDPLDPDDLAGLDEFHGLGRAATLTLADRAAITAGDRVLDVGAGIGGPARALAVHRGALVTALDPTSRFCELNAQLCRRTRTDDRVRVERGDARALPFTDCEFDVVWTQALWASVADKRTMLAEMHRVLRPGGRLALYETVRGPSTDDLLFPVPWANGPSESFLVTPSELRQLAEAAHFTVRDWLEGAELVVHIGDTAGSAHPAMTFGLDGITLALAMPEYETRMAQLARNITEQRITMTMAVLTKH